MEYCAFGVVVAFTCSIFPAVLVVAPYGLHQFIHKATLAAFQVVSMVTLVSLIPAYFHGLYNFQGNSAMGTLALNFCAVPFHAELDQ
jgi:hypothetical protein